MENRIVVDSNRKSLFPSIPLLKKYKDLFLVLAYRDFRVRYAQTFLGFVWAFIQPAVTLGIFVLVFNRAAGIDSGDIPYPVFAIVGMSAWTYFSYVMSQSGGSVIAAQNMIKKIYFPRLVIPLSKALVGLVDFVIVLVFLVVLMIFFDQLPSANIVYLPFFFFVNLLAAIGVGFWLSALTVRYRDFQHLIPFAVQVGLYISPVAYPTHLIAGRLNGLLTILYYCNPMAGVIEGYRYSILGMRPSEFMPVSIVVAILIFISGIIYFHKVESIMADII